MEKAPKLTQVYRLDSVPLVRATFTSEGYLVDRPILTRTGIFEYRNADGTLRRELRLPEEVFDIESLRSYRGKPIIITHDAGLVTKDNVHEHQIGTVLSDGYRSGDDVRAEIIIHDTDEMKSAGMKELSLGYNLDLDETPGVWEGLPYDAIQRNIRVNHLALVKEARAGDQARLNIDGRESIQKGGKETMSVPKKTHRNDGVLSPEELQKAIEEYKARRAQQLEAGDGEGDPTGDPVVSPAPEGAPAAPASDGEDTTPADVSVEEQVETIKERNADADGDMKLLFDIIDTLLAEKAFDEAAGEGEPAPATAPAVAEADGKCPGACDGDNDPIPSADPSDVKPGESMNTDSIDAIVRDRVSILRTGEKLNLDGLDGMSIMAAKKAIISAVTPSLRLDGKSEVYIGALFDRAVAEVEARSRKDTKYQLQQMFNQDGRTSEPEDDQSADARRRAMIERRQKKQ